MATPENVQLAAHFGIFMLVVGGLGLVTGTTISRSGIVRRDERRGEYYAACLSHLAIGAFCYLGQFFVPTG